MGKIKVIKRELKDKRLIVPIEYKPISERLTEMLTAKFRPGNPLEFEDTARDYQCLNQTNEQVTSPWMQSNYKRETKKSIIRCYSQEGSMHYPILYGTANQVYNVIDKKLTKIGAAVVRVSEGSTTATTQRIVICRKWWRL